MLFSHNVDPHSSRPTAGLVALITRTATVGDIDCFEDTSVIFGLELFTAVAAISTLRYRFKSLSLTLYIDNNAALAAIIKGGSTSNQAARNISFTRYLSAVFDITLRFERVSSALNIADAPSRGRPLPFPTPASVRFELPAVHYFTGYSVNILNDAMGSLELTQYRR